LPVLDDALDSVAHCDRALSAQLAPSSLRDRIAVVKIDAALRGHTSDVPALVADARQTHDGALLAEALWIQGAFASPTPRERETALREAAHAADIAHDDYRRARARVSSLANDSDGERDARIAQATAIVDRVDDAELRAQLARTIAGLPAHAPAHYAIGAHVRVLWQRQWYPAKVIATPKPGAYTVHYDGYDARWDETVGVERMEPVR
jgi:hypothetical protein